MSGTETGRRTSGPSLFTDPDGYERFSTADEDLHHARLLAVAEFGEVPDGDTVVLRENGIPWDLRPSNLRLTSYEEVGKRNQERGVGGRDPEYSREELLSWIESFVAEFGVAPSCADVAGWPGPSEKVYQRRLGGVHDAVREAGFEPRGVSHQ
jgi:hypothetical protein